MFFDEHDDDDLASQLLSSSTPQAPHHHRDSGAAASNVVLELIYATENERNCPTILPYPTMLLDRTSALLVEQRRVAGVLEASEQQQAKATELSAVPFRASHVIAADMQRTTFFLSELLRTRLAKIERLCHTIAHEGSVEAAGGVSLTPPVGSEGAGIRSALSLNEVVIAEQLAAMQQQCLLQGGLHLLPEPLRSLRPQPPYGEGDEMLAKPKISTHVFALALSDLGPVMLDADVVQEIREGEIFLLPYRVIAPFVVEGRARLV